MTPSGSRLGWLGCVLLTLVGLATSFASVLSPPLSPGLLGAGDSHWYFGPQAFVLDWALARGELPQWSPLTFCGQPFAGNPQAGVFYPLNLARSLLTPELSPWSTHVGTALVSAIHVLVAALSTFALARVHRLSTAAACTAALGMSLSASFVRSVCTNQFLGVVAWVPAILVLLERTTRVEGRAARLGASLPAGVLFGVSLLGGFPQLSIYVGAGLATYLVALRISRGGGPLGARLRDDVLVLAAVAAVGALVAAPMLFPAAELIPRTSRVDSTLVKAGALDQVAQHRSLGELLDNLIAYAGPSSFRIGYRASGAGILLLALAGLTRIRRRDVVVWGALFLVLCDCSLGPPFPVSSLIASVSPTPLILPSRGFVLACLPLAMLAAHGVDAFADPAPSRREGLVRIGIVGAIALPMLLRLGQIADLPERLVPWAIALPALTAATLLGIHASRKAPLRALLPLFVVAEIGVWNAAFVPALIEARGFTGDTANWTTPRSLEPTNRRRSAPGRNDLVYDLELATNGYDPLHLATSRQVICAADAEGEYDREIDQDEVTA